jgi:hypothetical protein
MKNERKTQEARILEALQNARGEWISGQYFLREMMLSQYHRAIWNLENRDGVKIEHSDFTDTFGFKSYRIQVREQANIFEQIAGARPRETIQGSA